MVENVSFWREKLEDRDGGDHLVSFVRAYLSWTHREQPERGCLLAALAPEAGRRAEPVRQVFVKAIEAYSALLSPLMQGSDEADDRAAALATLSQLVGALALARAVPDQKLANEIFEACICSINDRLISAANNEREAQRPCLPS